MTTEENKEDTPPKRRRSRKKIDVHALRTQLLATCGRYLDETPLDQLNGSMLKSIAEIVSGSVAADFERQEGQTQRIAVPSSFVLPFPIEGDPAYVAPEALSVPEKVTAGMPSVPVPTVRSSGGIKPPPVPFDVNDDYGGLQRRED